ncbi:MAG: AAA family ATPase [Chloroflexota bacterium]|nr:AAA family ATPase [Chloroflexota bacterium]
MPAKSARRAPRGPEPPTGTVAFLFTDIEGSTRLARSLADDYESVLERHRSILREAFSRHAGLEVGTEGDSFFVAFGSPLHALRAAAEGQRALTAAPWPPGGDLRVRMGLHVGEATRRANNYVGLEVHRAARIAAAGHGGQVLVSQAMAAVLGDGVPKELALRDLGEYRLKDFDAPAHLYQLLGPGLRDEFPPPRSVGTELTNLPQELTSFVGREAELEELGGLMDTHRLVTLIGVGGTGKTRLMRQLAAELLGHRADGVWQVELAPVAGPELVVREVARALGVADEPGRPVVDTLVDFLRSKSLVLLLDNCEHVIGAAADLAVRLLASCPALTVLATSREALGVDGETVFQVPSLVVPSAIDPGEEHEQQVRWSEQIAAVDAVRLFVDRARAVSSFALTPANAAAVVEICRRLDGIPLAIELAAARITHLSAQEIALGLGDRFRLLTGGRRSAVPRQQTLQALIDWSWDLLSEADRGLLRRLSVFAGGCTLEAAAAVTQGDGGEGGELLDTLDGLGRLVDRSLVVAERSDTTRYRLLETIRQYAGDRLTAAGEVPSMRGRHLAFFSDLALQAEPALRGAEMLPWLRRLDAEADNLRAALEWSFEGDAEVALRLSVAMYGYWRSRSYGAEAVERLARAADLAMTLPPAEGEGARAQTVLVARVLAAAGYASALWADASVGRPWAEHAVVLARQADDGEALTEALGALGMTRVFSGQRAGIHKLLDELVDLAESRGDWWTLAMIQTSYAYAEVMDDRHDLAAADARLREATKAADRSRNPFVIAYVAGSLGDWSGMNGRTAEARAWLGRAMAAWEEMGDRRFVLVARSDLAHALRRGGEIEEAEALYRETLHGWQHAGNRGAIANQLECFAFLSMVKGDPVRAARLFGAAEAIREVAGSAMVAAEQAEYDAAVGQLRASLDAALLDPAWAEGRRLTTDEAVALALAS